MGSVLKWSLPVAAVVAAIGYSMVSSLLPDDSNTSKAPGYQLPPAALTAGQKQPIHVDDAFRLAMNIKSAGVIKASFEIESNFYLYRDKIKVTGPDGSELIPSLPASKTKRDKHFGDSEVFDQSFEFTVPVTAPENGEIKVSATYQGCENEGICYPPVTKQFVIKVGASQ